MAMRPCIIEKFAALFFVLVTVLVDGLPLDFLFGNSAMFAYTITQVVQLGTADLTLPQSFD